MFRWRRGDVMLFDNLQLLHAGMPGFGPRELRVMLCNPIPIDLNSRTGVLEIPLDSRYESLAVRLEHSIATTD